MWLLLAAMLPALLNGDCLNDLSEYVSGYNTVIHFTKTSAQKENDLNSLYEIVTKNEPHIIIRHQPEFEYIIYKNGQGINKFCKGFAQTSPLKSDTIWCVPHQLPEGGYIVHSHKINGYDEICLIENRTNLEGAKFTSESRFYKEAKNVGVMKVETILAGLLSFSLSMAIMALGVVFIYIKIKKTVAQKAKKSLPEATKKSEVKAENLSAILPQNAPAQGISNRSDMRTTDLNSRVSADELMSRMTSKEKIGLMVKMPTGKKEALKFSETTPKFLEKKDEM